MACLESAGKDCRSEYPVWKYRVNGHMDLAASGYPAVGHMDLAASGCLAVEHIDPGA